MVKQTICITFAHENEIYKVKIMQKGIFSNIANFFKLLFKKDEEIIRELSEKELLRKIENAIFQANINHEYCVDLCYEPPREVIDKLLERGYQISVHQVTDYNSCHEYEEFPGGKMFTGEPFIKKKTKICW